MPTSSRIVAATAMAFMSGVMGGKPLFRAGSSLATQMAARMPLYMATPPRRGLGMSWTSRTRGMSTYPARTTRYRTKPVSR